MVISLRYLQSADVARILSCVVLKQFFFGLQILHAERSFPAVISAVTANLTCESLKMSE